MKDTHTFKITCMYYSPPLQYTWEKPCLHRASADMADVINHQATARNPHPG